MDFETQLTDYISTLVRQNTIIKGNLTEVNSFDFTGKAIFSFLVNDIVKEKKVSLFKQNDQLTWKFLAPTDDNELNYTEDDWNYPNYAKRIIAPLSLILDDTGIKMYGWFQINGFPVVKRNTSAYLYCNTILPEHQQIVDQLQGVITIEDRP
jgi:hypothetical protein